MSLEKEKFAWVRRERERSACVWLKSFYSETRNASEKEKRERYYESLLRAVKNHKSKIRENFYGRRKMDVLIAKLNHDVLNDMRVSEQLIIYSLSTFVSFLRRKKGEAFSMVKSGIFTVVVVTTAV